MKSLPLLAAICLLLLSRDGSAETGPPPDENAPTLFLHLIMPHYGRNNESLSHLVLTTPVKLSEVFAASTDDFLNRITGRVTFQDGKYVGRIEESRSNGSGFFNGEIELEKPFRVQGGGGSGIFILMQFVLSTNSSAAAFVGDPNDQRPKADIPRFPLLSAPFPGGLYGIDFQNEAGKQTVTLQVSNNVGRVISSTDPKLAGMAGLFSCIATNVFNIQFHTTADARWYQDWRLESPGIFTIKEFPGYKGKPARAVRLQNAL